MESIAETRVPRRIVTGHSPDGESIVLSDGPVPVSKQIAEVGVGFHEIWSTSEAPAAITAAVEVDPASRELIVPPSPLGTKVRINEFQPGHLDVNGLQSPVHRTRTLDYCFVLEGEIALVLDHSEVTLRAGDVVVQRGTDHAWANRGNRVARVAVIMVDAALDPALLEALPADAAAKLADPGPRF